MQGHQVYGRSGRLGHKVLHPQLSPHIGIVAVIIHRKRHAQAMPVFYTRMAPVFPVRDIPGKRSRETGVREYVRIEHARRIVLDAPGPGHRKIDPVQQMRLLALRTGNRQEQQQRQYEQALHESGGGFDGLGTDENIGIL